MQVILVIFSVFFFIRQSVNYGEVGGGRYAVFSLLIYLFFLILHFKRVLHNSLLHCLFFLIVSLLILLNASLLSKVGWGANLIFLSFWLLLLIFPLFSLSVKDIRLIAIGAFIFLFSYLFYFIPRYSLLLDYNTNTISYVIYFCSLYAILPLSARFFWQVVLICIVCITAFLSISFVNCRTALFVFTFVLLLRFVPVRWWAGRKTYVFLLFCLTFGSFFYVCGYVYLFYHQQALQQVLEEIFSFSDKELFTGRQYIWIELLDNISNNFWLGTGSKMQLSSFRDFNPHNSFLAVMAMFGIPTYCLTISLVLSSLLRLRRFIVRDNILKNAVASFLGSLLIGFSEKNLFDIQLLFVSVFFLGIAYSRLTYLQKSVI